MPYFQFGASGMNANGKMKYNNCNVRIKFWPGLMDIICTYIETLHIKALMDGRFPFPPENENLSAAAKKAT